MLFAFARTPPHQVLAYLAANKQTAYVLRLGQELTTVQLQAKLKQKQSRFLVALNFTDFKTNLAAINQIKTVNVILFAPVVKLREISLAHVTLLDIVNLELNLSQPFSFIVPDLSVLLSAQPTKFKCKLHTECYSQDLINTALTGSILTHLMTFLYKIPNGKTQNEYRDQIIGWLVHGDQKVVTLKKILEPIKQKEVKLGLFTLIKENMHYSQAFQRIATLEAQQHSVNYKQLTVEMNVNEFDLNYMLSIANKIKSKPKVTPPPNQKSTTVPKLKVSPSLSCHI